MMIGYSIKRGKFSFLKKIACAAVHEYIRFHYIWGSELQQVIDDIYDLPARSNERRGTIIIPQSARRTLSLL